MILPSVRAFLASVIDYAGLFPPAKLPLDAALRNYTSYRTGNESWMLGRFVLPATRLGELEPYSIALSSGAVWWTLSVLGRGGETADAFRAGIDADVEAVTAFRKQHGSGVVADAFEVRLPADLVRQPDPTALREPAEALGRSGLSVVYEVPSGAPPALFAALSGGPAGVKLRCGGLEAAAFPTPEQVARVIAACRDNGLALKFTAGLHHPLRHFDRMLQTKMHGLLNVFGAGVLAHALPLGEETIREILEEEDASNFGFDELGFGWKQYHALTDEIIAARRQFVVSFGSCSFDEPRDDLRAMGILP